MIPRTFPSVEVDGVRAMYVKVLDSVVGLQQWIDYIPVKSTEDPGVNLNTYNGSFLASVYPEVGGQAWKDYIPVYLVDYPDVKAWRSDNDGFIPLYGVAGWTPAKLFLNGEAGAWYDPSDLTTLFQDSAGTTAVTAVEQPVGLMLDKSRGLVLGSELVSNPGPFANITGWLTTSATPLAVSDGILTGTTAAATDAVIYGLWLGNPGAVAQNKYFELTTTITAITGRVRFQIFGSNVVGPWITAPGTYTVQLYQTVANGSVGLNTDQATTVSISSFSVKQVSGNHAFNSTALPNTVRPVLSARYNLLTYSEQFDNAAWRKGNIAITANAATAPDGTLTADKATIAASTAVTEVATVSGITVPLGVVTVRARVKADGVQYFNCGFIYSAGIYSGTQFDLTNGTIVRTAAAAYSGANATIEAVGNDGWYVCTHTVTVTTTSVFPCILPSNALWTAGEPRQTLTGNGADGVYIWGADLRVANESATIPYQRVVTATDYDATPGTFPYYLRFDGSDDWLQTASIDFSTVTSDGLPRRNLLSFPTAFDDAAWTKTGVTVVGVVTPPAGVPVAFEIAVTGTGILRQTPTVVATTHSASIYAKKKPGATDWVLLQLSESGAARRWWFNVGTGAIGSKTGSGTHSITDEGGGWYRCTVVFTTSAGTCLFDIAAVTADSGTTGDSAYISAAQLETGSTATAFQNIGTDKMSVFAGIRKLSDSALGIIAELSTSLSANNGTWVTYTPLSGSDNRLLYASKGTVSASAISNNLPAPITNILTGLSDISGDSTILRINGAQADQSLGDQGTGTYANAALYIGRRAGSSLPFNGRLYSLIVRGALTDAATIALAEDYVETKTFGKNMNIVYVDNVLIDGDQVQIDSEDVYVTSRYE